MRRLAVGTPVKGSPLSVKYADYFMHYYWFVISDVARDPTATFDYQVSLATTTNPKTSSASSNTDADLTDDDFNPDLYLSLMDGREPTATDYDLASTMMGAESIRISSQMPLWAERGWDPKAGVVVVVGVKIKTEDVPYTLLLSSNKEVAQR